MKIDTYEEISYSLEIINSENHIFIWCGRKSEYQSKRKLISAFESACSGDTNFKNYFNERKYTYRFIKNVKTVERFDEGINY